MTEPKITREEIDDIKGWIAAAEALSDDVPLAPDVVKRLLNLALQAGAMQPRPNASVSVMQSTAGPDYFVQLDCGGRTTTPYRFRERYKAEYHVAHFNWIFHGGEEPQLMDYNPDSWPGKPLTSLPEQRR